VSFVLTQAQRVDDFSEILVSKIKESWWAYFAYKPFFVFQSSHTRGCENPRRLGAIPIQSLACKSFFTSCAGQEHIHCRVVMKT
jgi:hypothetical protein